MRRTTKREKREASKAVKAALSSALPSAPKGYTRLNREVADKLVNAIRLGHSHTDAFRHAGIAKRTYQLWMKRAETGKPGDALYAALQAEMERAKVDGKGMHLVTVVKAAQGRDPRGPIPPEEKRVMTPEATIAAAQWMLTNVYDVRPTKQVTAVQTNVAAGQDGAPMTTTTIIVLPALDE
jgi:hypothetical protein